jgi:hypothetical protein
MSDRFEDARGVIQDLFDGDKVAVTHITTLKGAIRGNHVHDLTTQWTYVTSGKLRMASGSRKFVVEPGQMCVHHARRAARLGGARGHRLSRLHAWPPLRRGLRIRHVPARRAAADMKVGIIGLGVIGTAQAQMFAEHDLVTYDPAVTTPTRSRNSPAATSRSSASAPRER